MTTEYSLLSEKPKEKVNITTPVTQISEDYITPPFTKTQSVTKKSDDEMTQESMPCSLKKSIDNLEKGSSKRPLDLKLTVDVTDQNSQSSCSSRKSSKDSTPQISKSSTKIESALSATLLSKEPDWREANEVRDFVRRARSPGSKPRVIAARMEARKRAKKLRKCRSPGAAPHFRLKKSKNYNQLVTAKTTETTVSTVTTPSVTLSEKTEPPSSTVLKNTCLSETESKIEVKEEKIQKPPISLPSSTSSTPPPSNPVVMESQPATNTPIKPKSIIIEPRSTSFSIRGGFSRHILSNESNERIALKIKSSNNEFLRVWPVYAFVDAGTIIEIEITRLPGGQPKEDKLVLCYVFAKEEDTNPKALFTLRARFDKIVLPIQTRR